MKQIHTGDCLEYMRSLKAGTAGVIVTSPPYNLQLKGRGSGGGKWAAMQLVGGYADHADDLPTEKYAKWQKKCLAEMMRIIPANGAIFYNTKFLIRDGFLDMRREILEGLPVRQMIVWARAGGMNFSRSYFVPSYEVVFLIAKADFRLVKKASGLSDVWTIQQARDNEHPAPFPVELARRAIASVDPGLTVFDPFLGSGTTAVAAEALGRKWFGCELSPEYVKMAARRIREQRERMKLAGVLGAAR